MEILKEIFKTLESFSPAWKLFWLISIGITLFVYQKVKVNKDFQSRLALTIKRRLDKITTDDLLSSTFFVKMPYYRHKIKSAEFGNRYNTNCFRKLLTIKLDTAERLTLDLIKNLSALKHNNYMSNVMLTHVDNIVTTYEAGFRKMMVDDYGDSKGNEVSEYILNSENGFNHYHKRNIEFILNDIENVCTSKIFVTDEERIMMFLYRLHDALRSAVIDGEKVFKDFNGHIRKIIES